MKINIIVDSGADYTREEAKERSLRVIPLKLSFEEEDFLDGVNIGTAEFYTRLKACDKLPKTSQITPFEYGEAYQKIKDAGEQAIVVTLSSGLSGCYQSACIAAEDFEGVIRVVDSKTVSMGERIVVERAMNLINEGLSLDDIADTLDEDITRLKTIAVLDTLTYLRKGGRLSATACVAGTLLSLKPVVHVVDGAVEFLCTARGHKKAYSKLNEEIEKAGPIDTSMPRAIAYSDVDQIILKEYLAASEELYGEDIKNYQVAGIGPAIGTHIGPGAVAAAFFTDAKSMAAAAQKPDRIAV